MVNSTANDTNLSRNAYVVETIHGYGAPQGGTNRARSVGRVG